MTKTSGCEGKIVSRMHMIKNHTMIKIKSKLRSNKGIRKFSFSIQLNYREIFHTVAMAEKSLIFTYKNI